MACCGSTSLNNISLDYYKINRHAELIHSVKNSIVNNMSNIIIIQKANIKSSVGQHELPTNAKVESGAVKE
jgi:hypothetical protein